MKTMNCLGNLPQEIMINGHRSFLGMENAENGFAFFYQGADSFSPDIYVDAKDMQDAGKMMELELKCLQLIKEIPFLKV